MSVLQESGTRSLCRITQQPAFSWLWFGCTKAKQLPLQKEGKESVATSGQRWKNTQLQRPARGSRAIRNHIQRPQGPLGQPCEIQQSAMSPFSKALLRAGDPENRTKLSKENQAETQDPIMWLIQASAGLPAQPGTSISSKESDGGNAD